MYQYSQLPEALVSTCKIMGEDKDCSVKALAIALGTSYELAHRHLQLHCSRRKGRGIRSSLVLPQSLKNTQFKVGPYTAKSKVSLSTFCKKHPEGRFYVAVAGHAIGIVDGVVFDSVDSPRRMVKWAIRVYPKGA